MERKLCCTRGGARDIFLAWWRKAQRRAARRRARRNREAKGTRQAGRAMLDSVRVRLTFWYAGVLALFLVVLSLITYFIFWRSTLRRTDSDLAELSEAFLTTVQAEMLDNHGPEAAKLATQEAIVEERFRDNVFAVFNPKGDLRISSQDLQNESSPAGLLASASFRKLVAESARTERLFENVKGGSHGHRGLAEEF